MKNNEGKLNISLKRAVVYCLLTSLLLVLGWPPFKLNFLLFFGFIPLFFVVDSGLRVRKILLLVYISLLFWLIGSMYWITYMTTNPAITIVKYVGYLFIPLLMFLTFWVFIQVKSKLGNKDWLWFFLPFLFVAYEFLDRSWDLGFSFLNLGFGLSPHPRWIQFYQFTGVEGGTFLILLVNVLLYLTLKNWRNVKKRKKNTVAVLSVVLLSTALNSLLWFWDNAETKEIKVLLYQPNLDTYEKRTIHTIEERLEAMEAHIEKLDLNEVDLLIAPESFLVGATNSPFIINESVNPKVFNRLKKIAALNDVNLLLGFDGVRLLRGNQFVGAMTKVNKSGHRFNKYDGTLLIGKDTSRLVQYYTKQKMIPFIERPPFVDQIAKKAYPLVLKNMGLNFSKTKSKQMKLEGIPFANLICYEAQFPNYLSQVLKKGQFVVVSSNEEWSGNSIGHEQIEFYQSALAVCFKKNIVRCSNAGRSFIVNSKGEIGDKTSFGITTSIIDAVRLSLNNSFYSVYRSWFSIVSICFSILYVLLFVFLKPTK